MEYLKAFLAGGVLCAIGQILIDKTGLTPARILTAYVVAGVLLSALGLYQPLVDWAGAGATVPLTGFGHALANGVRRAVAERGFWELSPGDSPPVPEALPPPSCWAFWYPCWAGPGGRGGSAVLFSFAGQASIKRIPCSLPETRTEPGRLSPAQCGSVLSLAGPGTAHRFCVRTSCLAL